MKTALKYIGIGVIVVLLSFFTLGLLHPTQEYNFTLTVNAPVERTFAVFNDTSRIREWMPDFRSIENISGTAGQVGSKWKMIFFDHDKEIVMTETVTAFSLNQRFGSNLSNDFISSDQEILFSPKGNTTEISVHCIYKGGNIVYRSMFNFINATLKETQENYFNRLKQMAEKQD